jgi:2'-5' RNA ligase
MSLQCYQATMRLFFAILLPEDVRSLLSDAQSALRPAIGYEGVRWEDPDRFHITLRFLGEVASEKLENVKQAGREAAGVCAPFELDFVGYGAFPSGRQPRILWIGAQNGVPEYIRLDEYLYRALTKQGFDVASRWGTPHITIARAKSDLGTKAMARALALNNMKKPDKKGVFFVYNIVLVHSELQPEGSVYTILETFPLAAH